MKKTSMLAILPMFAALCLCARAEDAKPAPAAPPATLEKQIEYLEGAMAEGIKTKDWKMTEMAVKGFKAAGVTGKDLELSMLRAEKQAALESVWQTDLRAQIEVWGLVSRAKLGDTAALETIRKLASEKPVAVAAPNMQDYAKNPQLYQEQQKAQMAYVAARGKQDAAILALALLKEPNVLQHAIASLRASLGEKNVATYANYGQSPLVLAALAADANEGWKALVETAETTEVSADAQINLVQMLLNVVSPMQLGFQQATAFQVDTEIAATLPKDAAKQLWKPLIAAIKRYTPENNPQQQFGVANASLYTIPMIVDRMMAISENQQAVAALEDLKAKVPAQMAQYVGPQIDSVLNKYRKGVAPPKSPDTF